MSRFKQSEFLNCYTSEKGLHAALVSALKEQEHNMRLATVWVYAGQRLGLTWGRF